MRMHAWGALLALGLAGAAQGQAIEVDVRPAVVEHYGVRGRDIAAVAASLGSGHIALTRWRVTWKYRLEESRACRLKSFQVEVTAKIRMPRWVDRDAAPPKARARWDAFIEAVRKHEEGHRDHGVAAGRELARAVRVLGNRGDCRKLRTELDQLGERVTASYQALDREYDRATRHGITQGAILRG